MELDLAPTDKYLELIISMSTVMFNRKVEALFNFRHFFLSKITINLLIYIK